MGVGEEMRHQFDAHAWEAGVKYALNPISEQIWETLMIKYTKPHVSRVVVLNC